MNKRIYDPNGFYAYNVLMEPTIKQAREEIRLAVEKLLKEFHPREVKLMLFDEIDVLVSGHILRVAKDYKPKE